MDPWDSDTNVHGLVREAGASEVPGLTVLAGETQRTIRLEPSTMIGRAEDAQLRLVNDEVSRHHAVIERRDDGRFLIADLDSKNGTRVNGLPLRQGEKRPLELGDRITLGRGVLLLFAPFDGLEEQLIRAQRLESLGRLAGGVAHDFNNLLGTVLTNVSFLRRMAANTRLDHPDVKSILEDSETALKSGAELVRQLLGFARKDKAEARATNFTELTSESVRMLRRTIDRSITLSVELQPDVVVMADPNQLQQVVMNLVLNAADALPKGGTIRMRLEERRDDGAGPRASLEVSDDGEGMDEGTLARAFEPFFTTKEAGRGTGLGLALVHGVAKGYGGDTSIESVKGRGTKVRFTLPLSSVPETPTPDLQKRSSGENITGLVLVVDDEDLFRASTARLLRHLGFQVELAKSGKEAVELVQQRPRAFGAVLLDLMMPDMSGATTFHALRDIESELQVILISGHIESGHVDRLIEAGARAFVPKPFEVDTLRRELRAALGASAARS